MLQPGILPIAPGTGSSIPPHAGCRPGIVSIPGPVTGQLLGILPTAAGLEPSAIGPISRSRKAADAFGSSEGDDS